jgi:hypothetical protein
LPPSSAVTLASRDRRRPAGLGTAGQRDLGDVGVLGEAGAGLAGAGDDVDHAVGQPGVGHDLGDGDRGERRHLRRLDDHGVAVGQRGRQTAGQDQKGVVERGDDAAHAERPALLVGQVGAVARQHGLALSGQQTGVVAEPLRHPGQLRAGLGDRSAVVAGLEGVQPVGGLLDRVGDAQQQPGALAANQGGPNSFGESRLRLRHGCIDTVGPKFRDRLDDGSSSGVDDVAHRGRH